MKGYLLGRSLNSAVSLAGLVVLVFFLARLTGNPADLYLPLDVPAEVRHEFSERHGFNDPLVVQFGRFLLGLLRFDFGESMRFHAPALSLVLGAFPTSLALAALAMGIALTIAIVTGALAAWKPGGAFDRVASLLSLAAASLPNFWVAIVGVLLFAVNWRLLPTSGTGSWQHWVLPVAVLVIRPCGLLAQVVRSSMIGALGSAYVKTARAKGVRSRVILFVHALRNAMLPVVTVAGDQAAGLINGAVVVEVIFGFPGIGKLMIDAITYRDFALIQAGVLVTAVGIFALNTAVDLLYALLDPRIRHA
ncbi:ABC transporter permease [Roseomonas sp. OT10]|uniref:ABC transporter permease n=1 Tax=Roseomonas cutis TaxID=2897332 RepID=UPI001E2F92A8|nr:ABC transporter permease [Roseomonas sp. OT10]UFN49300.1 ABC transporter permease [Roseomonas sp. OT10]